METDFRYTKFFGRLSPPPPPPEVLPPSNGLIGLGLNKMPEIAVEMKWNQETVKRNNLSNPHSGPECTSAEECSCSRPLG